MPAQLPSSTKVDQLNWVSYPAAPGDDELVERWELTVIGKGEKERVVPVPIDTVGELSAYLAARGLDADPEAPGNQGAYLLGKATDLAARAPWLPQAGQAADPKAGITANTLYAQIKAFFTECATVLARSDAKGAQRLDAASMHWLRHTHGSHAVAAGMPPDVLQQTLGHASLDTTTIYVTTEDRRHMKAAQHVWE